jgi:peptide-methionine (S)-S-oxide reductase
LNRQGPDHGDQYRSVIFYYGEEQRKLAEEAKKGEGSAGKHADPVVTEISPASAFWRAEEYHQKYFQKNKVRSCGL